MQRFSYSEPPPASSSCSHQSVCLSVPFRFSFYLSMFHSQPVSVGWSVRGLGPWRSLWIQLSRLSCLTPQISLKRFNHHCGDCDHRGWDGVVTLVGITGGVYDDGIHD